LYVCLAGNEPGEHVLAESEIGGGGDAPHRHDHQRADHHPEGEGAEPELPPGVGVGVARGPPPHRRRGGATRSGLVGMMAVMVMCRRPSRHSRFPSGPPTAPPLIPVLNATLRATCVAALS